MVEGKIIATAGGVAVVAGGVADWYGRWLYYNGAAEGNVGKSILGEVLSGVGVIVCAGGVLGLIIGAAMLK